MLNNGVLLQSSNEIDAVANLYSRDNNSFTMRKIDSPSSSSGISPVTVQKKPEVVVKKEKQKKTAAEKMPR